MNELLEIAQSLLIAWLVAREFYDRRAIKKIARQSMRKEAIAKRDKWLADGGDK
jgi:hypothetical protein